MTKQCYVILLLCLIILFAGCGGGEAPAAAEDSGTQSQAGEAAPQDAPDPGAGTEQETESQQNAGTQTVEIWLSRHGQTIANAKDVCAGWSDAPLTDAGEEFTRYVGLGLADAGIAFDAVYSSDLGRCLQTADILLDTMGLSVPVQPDKRLREMHMGDYELESFSGFLEEHPDVYDFAVFQGMPGGENWDTLLERVLPALEEIGNNHAAQGGKILVTTHGYVIVDVIRMFQPDFVISHDTMPHNSITILEYQDGQLLLKAMPTSAYGDRGKELSEEGQAASEGA